MKKTLYIVGILSAGIVLIIYLFYMSFRNERMNELELGSEIVQISKGPIEYQITGDFGPVILFMHGAPGGYDAGFSWLGIECLPCLVRGICVPR